MLHCSLSLAAAQLLVKMIAALQKSECCSATSAAQLSESYSATSVFACGMLQGWGYLFGVFPVFSEHALVSSKQGLPNHIADGQETAARFSSPRYVTELNTEQKAGTKKEKRKKTEQTTENTAICRKRGEYGFGEHGFEHQTQ